MLGGLKMLISLKDKNKKLVVKDILDIDFDMSVEQENDKYFVQVNRQYQLKDVYNTEEEAEEMMLKIADIRNDLENELRNF